MKGFQVPMDIRNDGNTHSANLQRIR
jgi:hypothetical protein